MDKKTFVIDIDDTLIYSEKIKCDNCDRVKYKTMAIEKNEIDILNKLFDAGNTIILWTGRNWDCYDFTKKQLEEAGIKYHELVMGKPQGIYVDRDALLTLEGLI